MAIYEKRTYDVKVGHMPEVFRLYQEEGWPAITGGGFDAKLVGYFTSDTGPLHQLIHIWKFDDDADRRAFWQGVFSDDEFMKFAVQIRQHIGAQNVQLLNAAPWGIHP